MGLNQNELDPLEDLVAEEDQQTTDTQGEPRHQEGKQVRLALDLVEPGDEANDYGRYTRVSKALPKVSHLECSTKTWCSLLGLHSSSLS